jgi:endonuclease-3
MAMLHGIEYTANVESTGKLRSRLGKVYDILSPLWPDTAPLLHHRDCFELVCAVALSAQCTDDQVNRVTPSLFAAWPDAASLSRAKLEDVESIIHSLGFFRTKARHLVAMAGLIEGRFGGQVPGSMEDLLLLPGVGRKTANLVLSACFGQPGIIVDTHVLRVCYRLGIDARRDATAMERRIAELVAPERRTAFSYAVNRHGKFVCVARKPGCMPGSRAPACPIQMHCPRVGLQ